MDLQDKKVLNQILFKLDLMQVTQKPKQEKVSKIKFLLVYS